MIFKSVNVVMLFVLQIFGHLSIFPFFCEEHACNEIIRYLPNDLSYLIKE